MAKPRVIRRQIPGTQPIAKKRTRKAVKANKSVAKANKPAKSIAKKSAVKKKSAKTLFSKKKPVKHTKSHKTANKKQDSKEDSSIGPIIISVAVLIGILGLLVWAAQDTSNLDPENPYKPSEVNYFKNVAEKIIDLDKSYATDFHEEQLGKEMINPIFIEPYVKKLDFIWEAANASNSNETEVINSFLEARRRMLISQDYFQKALKFGRKGAVTKDFTCESKEELKEATHYYNQSFQIGRWATPRLDFVLRKSNEGREIIGLNLDKARWFVTPLGDIQKLVLVNTGVLEEYCSKGDSLNTTINFKKAPIVEVGPDVSVSYS